jgi:hypothetical protein
MAPSYSNGDHRLGTNKKLNTMPVELNLQVNTIEPGDIYEDAFYHPCLCIQVDLENDTLKGISLIDGSFPRSCSIKYSGLRLLSLEEAVRWKFDGPNDVANFDPPWLK